MLGAVSLNGWKATLPLFRLYYEFNGETFLDYLKRVRRKFGKLCLFLDKARQNYKTKIVLAYLEEQEDPQR